MINAKSGKKAKAKNLPVKSVDFQAEMSGGMARFAQGTLDLAIGLEEDKVISHDLMEAAAKKHLPGYNKAGEMHYNT